MELVKTMASIFFPSAGNVMLFGIHEHINVSVGVDYPDLTEVGKKRIMHLKFLTCFTC